MSFLNSRGGVSLSTLLIMLSTLSNEVNAQGVGPVDKCSNLKFNFPFPSTGVCLSGFAGTDGEKKYPQDFVDVNGNQVASFVKIYTCPVRQKRVILSNGLPNHDVTNSRSSSNVEPCTMNWAVEIPLNPVLSSRKLEVPPRGAIAFAVNGVPAFGPMESDSVNAVEPPENVSKGAEFWYGHVGGNSGWHVHAPGMSIANSTELTETDHIGYSLDGFPIMGPVDDPDALLDECNGRTVNGKYQYHVRTHAQVDNNKDYCVDEASGSPVNQWNYILGCYSGSLSFTEVTDSSDYILDDDCVEEGTTTSAPTSSPVDSGNRPNIIIMQPDDLEFFDEWAAPPNPPDTLRRPSLPSFGLPNLEGLRLSGVQMMQAYVASPKCGTSRFSTLTGKYPSRSAYNREQAQSNYDAQDPYKDIADVSIPTTKLYDVNGETYDCSVENMAATFQSNGYRTAHMGKWHLYPFSINTDEYFYEDAVNVVKSCGFDHVGALYVENLSDCLANAGTCNTFSDGTFSHNMEVLVKEAIEVINETSDKPFFMYFNPTVPHSSNSITTALDNFTCLDTPGGKLDAEPVIDGMTFDSATNTAISCADYRQSIKDRAGTDEDDWGSLWLDDSVGALLKALEAAGKLDNTIFLFQTDHGMAAKSTLYEGGIRIPQFISFPAQIEAGLKFDAPVTNLDIAATMYDFAGINPDYVIDGKSWKTAITDENEAVYWKNDRCIFFEMDKDRAVRCGCNKYLSITDQSISSTFKKGDGTSYASEGDNVFDLCAGTRDYVTGDSDSPEEDTVNLWNSSPDLSNALETALQCHLDNTIFNLENSFDECSSSFTLAPTVSKAPSSSPVVCEDSSADFYFKTKSDGTDVYKNCAWLNKKNDDRITKLCNKKDELRNACQLTCQVCGTKSPTVSPAPSVYNCQDSPTEKFYFKTNQTGKEVLKNCAWLRDKATDSKREKACKSTASAPVAGNPPASDVCPETCGLCPEVCADSSTFQFALESNGSLQGCSWMTKNASSVTNQERQDKYCVKQDVYENCPVTCGNPNCDIEWSNAPSVTPCTENGGDSAHVGSDRIRTCNNISNQLDADIAAFCAVTVDSSTGVLPAVEVCPVTCNSCGLDVSSAPSEACNDSTTFEFIQESDGVTLLKCSWLTQNSSDETNQARQDKYCVKQDVYENCPVTCGNPNCDIEWSNAPSVTPCTENGSDTAHIGNDVTRSCNNIGNQSDADKATICAVTADSSGGVAPAKEVCPVTCGECVASANVFS